MVATSLSSTRISTLKTGLAGLMLALTASGCDAVAEAGVTGDTPAPTVALPAMRVRVATVAPGTLEAGLAATGQLHPFRMATVAAEAPGRVTKRRVEIGDTVEQGASLFDVDASRARIQYDQAVANAGATQIDLGLASRELERGDKLLAGEDISRSVHDQLAHGRDAAQSRSELAEINRKLAARSLVDARAKAPFAGDVVQVHAELGDYVGPGAPLVTIADLSRLRLRVGVTAAEAHALSALEPDGASAGGSPTEVQVRFDDLGGLRVQATLKDVSPIADPRSGTYTAEFWLDQPAGAPLRQGMVGRVESLDAGSASAERGETLVVPREAVVRHANGFAVWVIESTADASVARRRDVTLGGRDAAFVEVRSGLQRGEHVAIEGMFALADGERVEIDAAAGRPPDETPPPADSPDDVARGGE